MVKKKTNKKTVKKLEHSIESFALIISELFTIIKEVKNGKIKKVVPDLAFEDSVKIFVIYSDLFTFASRSLTAKHLISRNNAYKFLVSAYFESKNFIDSKLKLKKHLLSNLSQYNNSKELAALMKEFDQTYPKGDFSKIRNKIAFHYDNNPEHYIDYLSKTDIVDIDFISGLFDISKLFMSIQLQILKEFSSRLKN